jgi:hypothetical protein
MSSLKTTVSGVCICGRERGNMNKTNWQRHIDSCALKKNGKWNQRHSTIHWNVFLKSGVLHPLFHLQLEKGKKPSQVGLSKILNVDEAILTIICV